MKVLLDTNVLLSGAFVPGLCARIIQSLINSPVWEIVLSEHLLSEFREHAKEKFKAPEKNIEVFLAPLLEWSEMVIPVSIPTDTCRDPNDLPVLGSAVAGKVSVLVTGDKDLLMLGSYEGIRLLSPREFHDHFLAG